MATDEAPAGNRRGTANRGLASARDPIRLPGITVVGRLPRPAPTRGDPRGIGGDRVAPPGLVPTPSGRPPRRIAERDMVALPETRPFSSSSLYLDQLDPRGIRQPLPARLERILGRPIDFAEAPSTTIGRFPDPRLRQAVREAWPRHLQKAGPSIGADRRSPYEHEQARTAQRALEAPLDNRFSEVGPAGHFAMLVNLLPYLLGRTSLEEVEDAVDRVSFLDEPLIANWFHTQGFAQANQEVGGLRDPPRWTSGPYSEETRAPDPRVVRLVQEAMDRALERQDESTEAGARESTRQTSDANRGLASAVRKTGNVESSAARSAAAPARTVRGSARPAAGETLVGSSTSQMRSAVERTLNRAPNHLLRFLLGPDGKLRPTSALTHDQLIDDPDLVQMGHMASKKSGLTERIMLQSAWENQVDNLVIEMSHIGGQVIDRVAIDIGGIAVSRSTAQYWESIGRLPPGTVDNAPIVID